MEIPDLLEKHGPGHHAAGVAHQEAQQGELAGLQLDRPVAARDTMRQEVEREVADAEHRLGNRARRTAAEGGDAGGELGERERLDQVVVGAGVQPRHAVVDAAQRREEEGRGRDPARPEGAKQAEPVEAGQHPVDDQHVPVAGRGGEQPAPPVGLDRDRVPHGSEPVPDERPGFGIVLDDQYPQRLSRHRRPARCAASIPTRVKLWIHNVGTTACQGAVGQDGQMNVLRLARRRAFLLLGLAFGGCATDRALPLPATAALHRSLASLDHRGVAIDRPLTPDAVARLAALNDPDLVAARLRTGIASAQVVQAGLLPNPQFTPGFQGNIQAPNALDNAFTAALAIDLKAIIERPLWRRAARSAARQADASVLWQEWGVRGQACLLAADLATDAREDGILRRERDLFARRAQDVEGAVRADDATIATLAPDLAAEQGADDLLATFERGHLARLQQLDALLGLVPGTPVPLATPPVPPPIDGDAIRATLPTLARRRPDLVALRFGYAAQEARLRAAIIGQFPALIVSIAGGRDNTRDFSVGPQPTIDLPIFNHNQGQIAIERATRASLRAEYEARITQATGDVDALLDALALEQRELSDARGRAATTRAAARDASGAYRTGLIDEVAYVDLVSADLGRAEQILTLERLILDQRIAIATLAGTGLPPVADASLADPLLADPLREAAR